MAKKYVYYPGCSLKASAKEYDITTQLVCKATRLDFEESSDWACCGSTSAHNKDKLLGIALATQELLKANKAEATLVAACALCYSRLKFAAHELKNQDNRLRLKEVFGEEIPHGDSYRVMHVLEFLKENLDRIKVIKPLTGLKVASYYGCLLVRPKEVTSFDDVENPTMMDDIVRYLGAAPIEWMFKTECCGGSHMLTRPDIVTKLSHRVLSQAKQSGAELIVAVCPVCQANLDSMQSKIEKQYRDAVGMPVIYLTQLAGLAMGFNQKQLKLNQCFNNPIPLLKTKGLVS